MTSEDFRISLRSTPRASTAASTVSIAVPVKRSLVGAVPLSLAISKVTSKRPLRVVVAHDDGLHAAGVGGIEPDIAGVAVEGQREIGGVAKAVLALQRARDLRSMSLPSSVRASRVTEISFRSRVSTPIT